jgi:hypothetical protein
MIGGLGNQMFQYSLFRNFLDRGENTLYEPLETSKYHNGFELNRIFNIIENPISSMDEVKPLIRFQENTWPRFNSEILNKKNTYLCGNWQNINYFPSEELLRKDFKFKQELDSKNKGILSQILESNSVSIHIRKGDYTTMPGYFFQADWFNYYALAINFIISKVGPAKFFIFSDDINWAKNNMMIPATYIQNEKKDSWKDMMLMSNCKHNIIANSTFSWWAAWLNSNPRKIITTPKKWFLDGTDSNLITLNSWIKI